MSQSFLKQKDTTPSARNRKGVFFWQAYNTPVPQLHSAAEHRKQLREAEKQVLTCVGELLLPLYITEAHFEATGERIFVEPVDLLRRFLSLWESHRTLTSVMEARKA